MNIKEKKEKKIIFIASNFLDFHRRRLDVTFEVKRTEKNPKDIHSIHSYRAVHDDYEFMMSARKLWHDLMGFHSRSRNNHSISTDTARGRL